jgi:uncharacterized membrane protein
VSVYEKGLVTILACNVFFALVALPLALRKIPRNRFYGYRTRATLSDDFVWYEANAYFGRSSLVAAGVATVAAFVISRSGAFDPGTYLTVSLVVLIAPALVAAIATTRYVRTLVD